MILSRFFCFIDRNGSLFLFPFFTYFFFNDLVAVSPLLLELCWRSSRKAHRPIWFCGVGTLGFYTFLSHNSKATMEYPGEAFGGYKTCAFLNFV